MEKPGGLQLPSGKRQIWKFPLHAAQNGPSTTADLWEIARICEVLPHYPEDQLVARSKPKGAGLQLEQVLKSGAGKADLQCSQFGNKGNEVLNAGRTDAAFRAAPIRSRDHVKARLADFHPWLLTITPQTIKATPTNFCHESGS